jgi:hypothetical protein
VDAVKMKTMAVMLGAVLAVAAARAEETAKHEAPIRTAPPASDKGPRISVDPAEVNFGKAAQNKTLTKEFTIHNLGKEDLIIQDVSTSCGCTAAVAGEKTVKAGGTTPLHVELQTRTAVGKIERTVVIRSNDPTNHAAVVKVQADVAADTPAAETK